MGIVGHTDDILWIQQATPTMDDVIDRDRVQMMDENMIANVVALNAEVSTVVPGDDVVPESDPLVGMIERLVQISLGTKRINTNSAMKLQVMVALNKRRE